MVRRVVLALALLVAVAAPASAHAELVSTDPAADSTVEAAPAQVTLTFDEEVLPAAGGISVVGSDGERADDGTVTRPDSKTVVVGLQPGLPAGRYSVEWRVLADDGDAQDGSFAFTVAESAAAPTTTSTTAASSSTTTTAGSTDVSISEPNDDSGVDAGSAILILVGIAILVAVIIGIIVRQRKREQP